MYTKQQSNFNVRRLVSWSVVVLLLMVLIPTTVVRCTKVDSGEVGIKFNKLSVSNQGNLKATTCAGFTFYNPITTDVFTYPVYIQRVEYEPFAITTKDAAVFNMGPRIAYQINRAMAIQIFQKYRVPLEEIEQGYMRTAIYDAYRIVGNTYTADDLMSNRADFESKVRLMLDNSLKKEGFIVTEFTSAIDPPKSLRNAIDAKNQAIQESLKAENEVKKAEANAKIAVAKAKGQADALKIQADGEAYYNRTVAMSLTPTLVQQYAIEKWNGVLPTYNGGGMQPFIQIK